MLPPRPPCSVDRRRTACGRAQEAADDVDRHHPLQARLVDLVDARLGIDDAGVVHQHRQRGEVALRLAKQALDVGLVAHVGADRDGGAARRSDLGHDGVRGPFVLQVVDRDRVPARRGQPRGGGTNPAAAAGDEHRATHAQSRAPGGAFVKRPVHGHVSSRPTNPPRIPILANLSGPLSRLRERVRERAGLASREARRWPDQCEPRAVGSRKACPLPDPLPQTLAISHWKGPRGLVQRRGCSRGRERG